MKSIANAIFWCMLIGSCTYGIQKDEDRAFELKKFQIEHKECNK